MIREKKQISHDKIPSFSLKKMGLNKSIKHSSKKCHWNQFKESAELQGKLGFSKGANISSFWNYRKGLAGSELELAPQHNHIVQKNFSLMGIADFLFF